MSKLNRALAKLRDALLKMKPRKKKGAIDDVYPLY